MSDHNLFEETETGGNDLAHDNTNDSNQHWGYSSKQNRKWYLSVSYQRLSLLQEENIIIHPINAGNEIWKC